MVLTITYGDTDEITHEGRQHLHYGFYCRRVRQLKFTGEEMRLSNFFIGFHRLLHIPISSTCSSGVSLLCKVLGLSPLHIHLSLPPKGMIGGRWVYYFLSDNWISPLQSLGLFLTLGFPKFILTLHLILKWKLKWKLLMAQPDSSPIFTIAINGMFPLKF